MRWASVAECPLTGNRQVSSGPQQQQQQVASLAVLTNLKHHYFNGIFFPPF